MASAKETLGQFTGKALELEKKGFQLYVEMVDKVVDSVVGLAEEQDNKGASLIAKTLNSVTVRKIAPFAVLGAAAFDISILPILERHKKD